MSKNTSNTSDDELNEFLNEFGIDFKEEGQKKEKRDSFDDLVERASLAQVVIKERPIIKKIRNLPFFLSLLLLHLITFACLYYLYLRIEKLENVSPPESINPPYSEEEIIIPLEPPELYKKTSFPV